MRDALATLRRPTHTGERRCWPCTALNGCLLALAVGAVVLAGFPALALALGVLGLVAIALRGYFVPYTPRFAPRLAARLPGKFFHAGATHAPEIPETPGSLADGGPDGDVVLGSLVDSGILVADGEQLHLDEAFRARWREEMAALRALDSRALADAVATLVPAADAEFLTVAGEEWVVLTDGSVARERWLSRQIAIAEVAAVRALADDLPLDLRMAAARPLRLFLARCPTCEAPVAETTAAACCGGPGPGGPDEVLACLSCETRLFTFPS